METNNIKLCKGEFFLSVDYDEDFEDILKRGYYDSVANTINEENFKPVRNTGERGEIIQIARFFCYPKNSISLARECNWLLLLTYRVATLRELASYVAMKDSDELIYGAAYGSVYTDPCGKKSIPYLSNIYGLRRLHAYFSTLRYEDAPERLLAIRYISNISDEERRKINNLSY